MNKILTINLGGYPYTIDDDAYEILNRYLDSIRRHFKANQSYQEIISDIETRLAEIFGEKLGNRTIISTADVDAAIAIMGKPEEFGAEPIDGQTAGGSSASGTAYDKFRQEYRTGKRLFRDPDDKVLGGVCAGVAAYFGVQDPLWVRIGFAIALFGFGVGFMLYLLLLIILPEAHSSADRLAMRGKPINVENIAKVVEEEFNNISNNIKGGTAQNFATNAGAKGVVADVFSFMGQIFYGILNTLKMIAKPFIFIFGVLAFVILALLWIGLGIGAKAGYPFSHFAFGDNSFLGNLAFVNLFFVVGLGLLGIGLVLARVFFKIKVSKYWSTGIAAFWLLNGISLGILGATFGAEFSNEGSVKQDIFSVTLPSDTLIIDLDENNRFQDIHTNFGSFKFDHDKMLNSTIELNMEPSTDNSYRLVKESKSNGNTREEAENLANAIDYQPRLEYKTLFLPTSFTLSNTKYRGQRIEMTLFIPEGKYVKLKEGTGKIVRFNHHDRYYRNRDADGYTWQMKDGEMISPEILSKENFTKTVSLADFTKISIKGYTKVVIRYGEKYDVQIKGNDDAVKDFEVEKTGATLRITQNEDGDNDDKTTIIITTPKVEVLDLKNIREASISGFSQAEIRYDIEGDFKLESDVDVKKLLLNADNNASIVLKGKGENLEAILSDNSELNARQFEVKTAAISLRDGCEADIYATEKVTNRRNEGNLTVEGGAKTTNNEQ
jgi:phage shock protein PspC (stress-responsive transcriptional regulator)